MLPTRQKSTHLHASQHPETDSGHCDGHKNSLSLICSTLLWPSCRTSERSERTEEPEPEPNRAEEPEPEPEPDRAEEPDRAGGGAGRSGGEAEVSRDAVSRARPMTGAGVPVGRVGPSPAVAVAQCTEGRSAFSVRGRPAQAARELFIGYFSARARDMRRLCEVHI